MKNKTFSADSVRREGYCIIWGVILLLHHTTMPASTMSLLHGYNMKNKTVSTHPPPPPPPPKKKSMET